MVLDGGGGGDRVVKPLLLTWTRRTVDVVATRQIADYPTIVRNVCPQLDFDVGTE